MDRNFQRALALVLKSEGGWSDNPADPGGATMKGVTLATYRRYINPQGAKDDLRHITDAQLADVYKRQYWDAVAGDDLPDGVDYATFDFSVNSGPGRAARYLQSVVGAPLDGTIGPATLAAVAKLPSGVIIDRLCDARLAFLQSLGTWHTFGIGWSARVASVRKNALLMTAQAPLAGSQQIGAPSATGPVTSVPNNPVPAKPLKHVTIGVGGLAIGAVVARFWGEISAWLHSIF